jgi:soluble lytic murein transglycosylase-like protein
VPKRDLVKAVEKTPSCFNENESEKRFHPIILKAANRFQVDPALVKAIIMAESGYDPRAISKMGAKGLMQLMPATAQELGVEDAFNPKHNINAGVGYLKKLLNRFDGDVKLALAAYNAGTGKVRKYQGIPPFKATRYYIKKVFEYYQIYKKKMAGEPDRA